MKKFLAIVLILSMVVSSTSLAFASESIDAKELRAEHKADVVERVVGNENINTNVNRGKDAFVVSGESIDVVIPKAADDTIVLDGKDTAPIAMGLPKEIETAKAKVTDSSTVVYDASKNVSVAVQVLSEKQDEYVFDAVRTMVIIENSLAPQKYTFNFELPEGYSLVKDTEYCDEWDEYDCDAVYILNERGEVVNTIEPAWAKDANGNSVNTYYEIRGNNLIQIVNFDEKAKFPIVADPTSHPNKYTYVYYTKDQVEDIRDSYATLGIGDIIKAAASSGASFLGYCANTICKKIGLIGTAWGTIEVANVVYKVSKYTTWNNICNGFKSKKYACVRHTWRYHQGKRCYYPHGQLESDYVNQIGTYI